MTDKKKLHIESQYRNYTDMWTSLVESGASGSVWFSCQFVSCPGVSVLVRVTAPASYLSLKLLKLCCSVGAPVGLAHSQLPVAMQLHVPHVVAPWVSWLH